MLGAAVADRPQTWDPYLATREPHGRWNGVPEVRHRGRSVGSGADSFATEPDVVLADKPAGKLPKGESTRPDQLIVDSANKEVVATSNKSRPTLKDYDSTPDSVAKARDITEKDVKEIFDKYTGEKHLRRDVGPLKKGDKNRYQRSRPGLR